MRRRWIGFLLIAVALVTSGCSDFVDGDQLQVGRESQVTLKPGHPVGQTFVARHGGLDGVEIWLEPRPGTEGELQLHLRADPEAEGSLATPTAPLTAVTTPGFYRFSFPPLRDSHGHYYYAVLEMDGKGDVDVGAGPGDAYLDGALYRDHEPRDAQMSFRLIYDPRWMVADLAVAAVRGLGLLGVAGLLYVVPGWALLVWLWPQQLSWAEKVGLAAGMSLALYPLLLLWTDLVGLHLGLLYAWGPILCGLAALVWRYRDWRPQQGWKSLKEWARSDALWPDVTLVIVTGLVFGVRLLIVRTLDAPMWGDSYQHTMIAQLLVDNGGLFDSWEPYAQLRSLTYHFGFHAAMASWHWLTRISMTQAVLWGAQMLNGLAVLTLYPLAVRVGNNRWAGVGAVLVAGLLSPMPMTYVNWGRYTQLAGQVVLPAAVLISWRAFETSRRDWRPIALAWLGVGGLALTHYRVLIFYVVFVLGWIALSLGRMRRRRALDRAFWVGIGSAGLFLPWFAHILGGRILRNLGRQLTTAPGRVSRFTQQYNAIGNLTEYLGPALWLLTLVAAAVGMWRRRREVLLLAVWCCLLFIATNPRLLQLPGSGTISNFALFIAAYIPAAVLIGYLLGEAMGKVTTSRVCNVAVAILATAVSLWAVRARLSDVRPSEHALVTRPDLRAMAWMRENTSEDSRFLVNSFFAYGGGVIVGSDGGWWLPLLAERENTVPPLNYGTERGPSSGYREWVNAATAQMQEAGIDDPETRALLEQRNVTHVYVGQQQGRVNYIGPHVLDPETIAQSEHYQPVYHRDRVWVFETRP
ncbi:MAG: hypothetical protein PVF54_06380 [Anaerolineae bacterium]|jgi:hypothetical protein